MQGTWVQALVQEYPTCHGATKPSHEGRDHDCFIHQCISTLGTELGTKTPITRKGWMNCLTLRRGEPGPTSNGECRSTPSNRLPGKHTVRERLKASGSKQRRADRADQGAGDQPRGSRAERTRSTDRAAGPESSQDQQTLTLQPNCRREFAVTCPVMM
ncbi:hypothetical protein J1605_016051 [Eschrichtius robustus]|uniref:Uncharacterized protein n=1 Tax=Eschrichtius robustus TaxID=9764 RepID=A0AB34G8K0_ESCRO|nr:hypothetical protein J1605_016051 [Eschrichtius robustus]